MKLRQYHPNEDNPVAIYRAFLSGELRMVHLGMWQDETAGRAVLEHLWHRENIGHNAPQVCISSWFDRHRLRGLLDRHRGSPYALLTTLYPGRWQPVEFRRLPHVADLRQQALIAQGIDPALPEGQRVNRTVTVRCRVLRRCRSCRGTLPEGWQGSMCPGCRGRTNAYTVRERKRRIAAGLCGTLGCAHTPLPGRRRCPACGQAQMAMVKRWRMKRRT